MNILVTGASGFVGSALVTRLEKSAHRVVPLQTLDEYRHGFPPVRSQLPADAVFCLSARREGD